MGSHSVLIFSLLLISSIVFVSGFHTSYADQVAKCWRDCIWSWYWSRTKKKIDHIKCFSGADGLKEVLRVSEILILLLPLTSETRFILNDESLQFLPKKSNIINAGRGELIKDNALIKKLRSGDIKNATLDVFQQEPLPKKHPYWVLPNVTVTPHIAADTPVESSAKVLANNIKVLMAGKLPNGMVDLNRGYWIINIIVLL